MENDPRGGAEQRRHPHQERARTTVGFILDAAAQLFTEHGYRGTTTNSVADRAGVSIGTVYQYFSNKDDVLQALLRRHLTGAATLIVARLAAVPYRRPAAAAAALVYAVAEHNPPDPRLTALLHEHGAGDPRAIADLRRTVVEALAPHASPDNSDGGRARLQADLCVRTVEHLIHATILDPPEATPRQTVLNEIIRLAAACLDPAPGAGTTR